MRPSGWASLACLALMSAIPAHAADPPAKASTQTSLLKKLAITDVQTTNRDLFRGLYVSMQQGGPAATLKYPEMHSDKPRFGEIRQDFGLGGLYAFALDESQGPGKGYDVVYFDANANRDLTDDPPVKRLETMPGKVKFNYSSIQEQFAFETVTAVDPEGELPPVELIPRFRVYSGGRIRGNFLPACAYQTQFDMDGQKWDVVVSVPTSRAFVLHPEGMNDYSANWSGHTSTSSLHPVNGALYSFEVSPDWTEMTTRRYDGPMGKFMLGAGGRNLTEMTMSGAVTTRKYSTPVGDVQKTGRVKSSSECLLPVDDYTAAFISIRYGSLAFGLSANHYVEHGEKQRDILGIEIREDHPCVLDFCADPKVIFSSPVPGQRVKAGGNLSINCVLTGPKLNLMIRNLSTISESGERTELEPKVLITRADGEKVVTGAMPYG